MAKWRDVEKVVMAVPMWFGRKFDLSFPVELLPNVLIRLHGAPARLEQLVK